MRNSKLRLLVAACTPSGEPVWIERAEPRLRSSPALWALVAGVVALSALLLSAYLQRTQMTTTLVPVTVERGDTLWALAGKHCDSRRYIPKAVYEIRRANGLRTSDIVPGQKLLIPVQVRVDAPAPASVARVDSPTTRAIR